MQNMEFVSDTVHQTEQMPKSHLWYQKMEMTIVFGIPSRLQRAIETGQNVFHMALRERRPAVKSNLALCHISSYSL